jgi:1,4-dihydroxy-2-naphthoate octaprenyltransferase
MSIRAGVWRLADPKISLASMASIALGASAAAADGPVDAGWLALTVAGIFAIEVAKNASGEVFDFDSGDDQGVAPEDRSPFSGGKRVLVDRLLTRRHTVGIAALGYSIGIGVGLVIAILREPRVLGFGVAGVACAYLYHAPPVKLSYRGLGETAVAVCYGPLICAGTYLVQRGTAPLWLWAVSLPLGLLIGAFLWINEFPDYRADRAAGKRTLVVRLGRRRASRVFAAIVASAFLLLFALLATGAPRGAWGGVLAAMPAAAAARRLWTDHEVTGRIVPAQAWTLVSFLLYSAGASAGILLAR